MIRPVFTQIISSTKNFGFRITHPFFKKFTTPQSEALAMKVFLVTVPIFSCMASFFFYPFLRNWLASSILGIACVTALMTSLQVAAIQTEINRITSVPVKTSPSPSKAISTRSTPIVVDTVQFIQKIMKEHVSTLNSTKRTSFLNQIQYQNAKNYSLVANQVIDSLIKWDYLHKSELPPFAQERISELVDLWKGRFCLELYRNVQDLNTFHFPTKIKEIEESIAQRKNGLVYMWTQKMPLCRAVDTALQNIYEEQMKEKN